MRIEECIQYVLLEEQYVSLPTIGSFIREIIPSHIDSLHRIYPTQHIVSFSEERTFDDGALSKYLLQHSTLDEEAVQRILQKWLRILQQNLNKGLPIYFQGIGILKKDGQRYILCADTTKLNLAAPILNTFQLPKPKGIGKRKSRRTSLWVISAISISIVSTGLILTYWLVAPPSQNSSPSTVIVQENKKDSLIQDSTIAHLSLTDTTLLNKETQQILDSTHRQVNALRVETPPPTQKKYAYYIVAGSISSIENANKLKEELLKKGYHPEVHQISSMYRVTLGKFYDKKTGIKETNKRRTELNDDSYWLIETVENK